MGMYIQIFASWRPSGKLVFSYICSQISVPIYTLLLLVGNMGIMPVAGVDDYTTRHNYAS